MTPVRNLLILGSGMLGFAVVAPAFAVPTRIDGYSYDLPSGADKNLEAARAIIAASDALGMTRLSTTPANLVPRAGRCPDNVSCLGQNTAAHEYRAHGVWNGAKVDTVVIDFDYRLPALRVDATNGGTETVS